MPSNAEADAGGRVATSAGADALRIGGLTPLSTCDWPGQLVATVFLAGCPLRCRYCHNAHLRDPQRGDARVAWIDVLELIGARRGLLDAVVFSGGEPTAQAALAEAVRAVRRLGFRVGLHTAGPDPAALVRVLPDVDWVGFDVKAPFDQYDRVTGVRGSGSAARESLIAALAGGAAIEVRTTVHPALLAPADLDRLSDELVALGVRRWVVQRFRARGCPDVALASAGDGASWLPHAGLGGSFAEFEVRA